jgi:hypothetical protein
MRSAVSARPGAGRRGGKECSGAGGMGLGATAGRSGPLRDLAPARPALYREYRVRKQAVRRAGGAPRSPEWTLPASAEEVPSLSAQPPRQPSLWASGRSQMQLQPSFVEHGIGRREGPGPTAGGERECAGGPLAPTPVFLWSGLLLSPADTGAQLLGTPPKSCCSPESTTYSRADLMGICAGLWEEAQGQSKGHPTGEG